MHFTVQEVSAYLVTVSPEASSRAESFLILASPWVSESAPLSAPVSPSDQVRNPNDLMRSLRIFSATGEVCGGALGWSASRTEICTATLGLPLARISSMRSSRDIWLSD